LQAHIKTSQLQLLQDATKDAEAKKYFKEINTQGSKLKKPLQK